MVRRLTELKYEITKLDAKIENMRDSIEKMALHDKKEVGIEFLTSTVKYFKELREYLRAEEQGLLLRSTCKVGDSLYVPYSRPKYIKQCKVLSFQFDGTDLHIITDFVTFSQRDIGVTAFLDEESAENSYKGGK